MAQSANVTWQDSNLSRALRWRALGARGATVWLTGLPAAGKSTLGAAVEERLVGAGRFAYLLDGDNLRHGICGDLGFDEADRARNILRVGELARLFADAGAVAIVALVSPLAAVRDEVRSSHAAARLPFIEVFLDTPLVECAARDPKNLYARANAGELADFTGVGQVYEPPAHPEVTVPSGTDLASAVDAVLGSLDTAATGARPQRGRRRFAWGREWGRSHQRNGAK
ncbi:MAG TPA: adenylyl-sulfate kinase [Solirubrobacteraceae bacterium]|jgi:adenylyl-sulfate kinase|nr:adenylyl-sulfate kinase [Solirubrobacteraceae bacterium]